MVLGKYRNIFEDDEPIPANANSWDFLPVPANGRPSFDVMPVLTWKNFTALEQTPTKAISSRKISNCIGAPRLGLAANLVFFLPFFITLHLEQSFFTLHLQQSISPLQQSFSSLFMSDAANMKSKLLSFIPRARRQ